MKKIDEGTQFITEHLALFRCPTCGDAYDHVAGHTVVCSRGHSLDLNRKGSLYFLNHAVATEYDALMLAARRRMLTAGLFAPIVQEINAQLAPTPQRILDVGTGEGTPLAQLDQLRQQPADTLIGFDISKDGVNLATQLATKSFFCVADLANLPFANQSFDAVIELFSPSAYREFERVIRPGGQIIKVVPNANYLVELRHALYEETDPQYHYQNERVVDLFEQHYPTMTREQVQYQFSIGAERIDDMLAMTPLSWGTDDVHRKAAKQDPVAAVTVDVSILSVTVGA
ncbi:methyltransferase domain-containing protein [Furfurilactobacillus sp. WILCCON 0119]